MTRSSTVWATDAEANDLADDKPTLSKASTPLPFDDRRNDDDEADSFDAEAGWTDDERLNQKGDSPRKNAFSYSPLLPSGVGAIILGCWGCIGKMPRPWASGKKGVSLSETTNLSEAEIELLVAQAMGFLNLDNTIEATEVLMNSATTSMTMAPSVPTSTPPTAELAEMAASNAAVAGATSNVAAVAGASSNVAVVAGATSNVAAASATSVVTAVGGTGAFIGASVIMATVLSPVNIVGDLNKPTPSPSPYPTIIPKVQCPDAGAAMFAGYKVSNTSEDWQLLMVTLTDLPERLELFLTNSFSLPTMNEEFAGNKTGSVKMIVPSGGFSAGTLFGYESPTLAISNSSSLWSTYRGVSS